MSNQASANQNVELKRQMRTIDGWAIGTGAMMGVTIFAVSGSISGMAGPAACLGFVIAAIIVIIVALCYCEVATAFPGAGGAYNFPKKAIGGKPGNFLSFFSGWCIYGGQGLASAIVAMTCASYVTWLIELLGFNNPISDTVLSYLLIILFGVLNMFSTKSSRIVQLASTFIIAAVLVIFIIWGGANVDPDLTHPFAPNGVSPVWACAATCILSFSGWSTIPAMSEEFENPDKQIPRSILLSLLTCGIIFTLFVYVMNGLMPGSELAESSTPPADALATVTKYGATIVAVGGLFACFSTCNSLLLTGSRVPFAMSRSGDLPTVVCKTTKNKTPFVAIILTVIGQLILASTGMLIVVAQMSVFATASSWIISIICLYFLRSRHKEIKAPFHAPAYPVTFIIALAALVFMMTQLSGQAIRIGVIWMILGLVCFWLFRKTPLKKFCRNLMAEEAEEEEAQAAEAQEQAES